MEEDGPSNATKNGEEATPQPPKNGAAEGNAHRYEVGPGFEIAVRGEGKHGVEFSVSKEGDLEHRHGAVNRRLDSLEQTVADLAARLARVEAHTGGPEKGA